MHEAYVYTRVKVLKTGVVFENTEAPVRRVTMAKSAPLANRHKICLTFDTWIAYEAEREPAKRGDEYQVQARLMKVVH